MRQTYTVHARRGGKWWALEVQELPGVFSQARRLDHVEAAARDAIALFLDAARDSFDVTVRQTLDPELSDVVVRAVAAKGRAAAAQTHASNLLREAARMLTGAGMTIRDAGKLLGMTHQRVAQLLASSPESPAAASVVATVGDDDRPVDVYTVGGHRRSTAREVVEEVRETDAVR